MLSNKTIFITGASRGIGRSIALKCAANGANIVIASKTVTPHKKLPGTIFSVAKEVEELGGQALALEVDIRDEKILQESIDKAASFFGGIDICINNASAIYLANTSDMPARKFDLIHSINVRGTFLCSKFCIPYLKKSSIANILNISPPMSMESKWFAPHLAYTMSKYGMSMCTLGMAEELKQDAIRVNSLWPKTTIATSAIKENFPAQIYQASRYPEIMADAAYEIFTNFSDSGRFYVDEEVLSHVGIKDFNKYSVDPTVALYSDLFISE